MTDRSGIEIDYCPECRGVWLDRGELDKIIERSSQDVRSNQDDSYFDDRKYSSNHSGRKHKKKKGILGELFDF